MLSEHNGKYLLLTRPKADAVKLSEDLPTIDKAHHILAPVFQINKLKTITVSDADAAYIFTSRHAAECVGHPTTSAKAFCVGAATAAILERKGFDVVATAPTAQALVEIIKRSEHESLVYVRGVHVAADIEKDLTLAGLETNSVIVYEQIETAWDQDISNKAKSAKALIIPLFSPRSAQLTGQRLAQFEGEVSLVAMSDAVLNAWSGPVPQSVVVADQPNIAFMKQAICGLWGV